MNTSFSMVVGSFAPDLFRDRQVLISGASSGIGLELARGFSALGASVLATGSSLSKLSVLGEDPANVGISFAQLDVRDTAAISTKIDGLDRLDVLVNAAGIARPHEEYEQATFLDVIDVNLNAAMRTAMAGREKLGRSGVLLQSLVLGCVLYAKG